MPSRRSVLATAVAVVGAGCSSSGESDVDPAEHVPDDWHDEPKRGLADTHIMSADKLSRHPQSDCSTLAAEALNEVIEERLDDPENVGGGCCLDVDGNDQALVVERVVMLRRNGEAFSSPNIVFQTVREATPQTVKAPDESEHDCQHPVYVVDVLEQQD